MIFLYYEIRQRGVQIRCLIIVRQFFKSSNSAGWSYFFNNFPSRKCFFIAHRNFVQDLGSFSVPLSCQVCRRDVIAHVENNWSKNKPPLPLSTSDHCSDRTAIGRNTLGLKIYQVFCSRLCLIVWGDRQDFSRNRSCLNLVAFDTEFIKFFRKLLFTSISLT